MKELYRSFEGLLNIDNPSGYVVYELKEWYQVDFLNVYCDVADSKVRFAKDYAPDHWGNAKAIAELDDAVFCGRIPGQMYYRGKGRTPRKIMDSNGDYIWTRYCE